MKPSHHSFHIPVMGLAFTIDTPIKVARFGISSVISIIQDNLVEKMRSHYYPQLGEPYRPILNKENDYRAKRITDYLNLVNRIVKQQIEVLKTSPFQSTSEINKYFEMLPEGNPLTGVYRQMLLEKDKTARLKLESILRKRIVPGSIDVNIMTKLDRNITDKQGNIIEDGSDAVTALRGYAMSDLTDSSLVLSAGVNPRLFNYMEKLTVFDADNHGLFTKRIVLKVSDFRSAFIQGKMLAKKGLWVSEFRIESGLNCGGHAFATDGYLLGPILEEFKNRREELINTLFEIYNQSLKGKGKTGFDRAHPLRISVQGGIGTCEESEFLRSHYSVDSTGWGTPFLLVPEATNVDDQTLKLLSQAKEKDVVLSKNSPLGIRFHYLKGTSGENEKLERIRKGAPGSPCTEKYLVSNTEFTTEPICTASHSYQSKKIEQLQTLNLPEAEYQKQLQDVLAKECLCIGLSNSVIHNYKLKPFKKLEAVNVCPGPNIAYFTEVVPLQKMVDHIYGRTDLIYNVSRPHMFIKELTLYIDYWKELLQETRATIDQKQKQYIQNFYNNLINGIGYYRNLTEQFYERVSVLKSKLNDNLDEAETKLNTMLHQFLTKVDDKVCL
ncbi:MAG: hypothetical protein JST48_15360 [Bacteroidetes bacterium]|nr:hypothetical protein [Bacteroidota bacterium]